MSAEEFDGSLILEKLAEIGEVDNFYEAVDADDFSRAKALLRKAGANALEISIVLEKMANSED